MSSPQAPSAPCLPTSNPSETKRFCNFFTSFTLSGLGVNSVPLLSFTTAFTFFLLGLCLFIIFSLATFYRIKVNISIGMFNIK